MSGFVPGTAPKDVDLAWPPELEAMITKKFSDLKFYKLCLFLHVCFAGNATADQNHFIVPLAFVND